ncbi:enolase C-terminal domain-like protein [Mycolicibacterium sphagni]|uniref:O-succinylbenzoate synthase n=1 Tax=Mycolicibacterium sphagni TaxID=1786 RepID=A0A255DB41_9MYCO|nr:enolase C-terminal domain-like protein [Mycolicibacterium sphagni]MCV7178031.1 O-succinylbenzoate synthase [Mycolicibacterium sphagni]OYN76494.1 O-succinylbenzoate synthase [Mycolicibacterium sphagni]
MKALIDFDGAPVFAIPARDGYRGVNACEGMLIEGPQGWGEFCPPPASSDLVAARWLTSAIEGGTVGWPDPVRGRVAVSVPVPAVSPDDAGTMVGRSGCRAADVRVTGGADALAEDLARLEAVRAALGPAGSIRCSVERLWDVDTAAGVIPVMNSAAGGLEFVQQPCATAAELAALRRRIDVRVAVEVASLGPDRPPASQVADIAVLAVGPLGGVRRALRFAEHEGLPCIVSAAPGAAESSIGLAGGLALAGVLPDVPFACGLGTATLLAGDVVSAGRALLPVEGYLPVSPMAPGPDPDRVAEFSLDDAERVAWWRGRLRAVRELL